MKSIVTEFRLVRGLITAVLSSTLVMGCVGHRPAPVAPSQDLPSLELPPRPPPDGYGRLIVDAVDGPSTVNVVEGAAFAGAGTAALFVRTLCETPCVVDLPYGQHDLRFGDRRDRHRWGESVVNIQGETTVLRTHLGRRTGLGWMALTGASLFYVGAVDTTLAGIVWGVAPDSVAARNATFAGVGAMAVGLALWLLDRPVVQPSASTQWGL